MSIRENEQKIQDSENRTKQINKAQMLKDAALHAMYTCRISNKYSQLGRTSAYWYKAANDLDANYQQKDQGEYLRWRDEANRQAEWLYTNSKYCEF